MLSCPFFPFHLTIFGILINFFDSMLMISSRLIFKGWIWHGFFFIQKLFYHHSRPCPSMLKSPADLFSDTLHVILKILMDKLRTSVIRHVKKIVTKICQLKCIWESTCILSLLNSFTVQSAWGHNLFLVIFPVVKFLSTVLPLIPTIISLSHL